MASIVYPDLAKKATLSDGTTYGYVSVPASEGKPTFVFLHGYPSTSYDWRHQIAFLQKGGYGVIAPDLLGYGDTDKPTDLKAYRLKVMSQHVIEILDRENVSRAVLVAHDWYVHFLDTTYSIASMLIYRIGVSVSPPAWPITIPSDSTVS